MHDGSAEADVAIARRLAELAGLPLKETTVDRKAGPSPRREPFPIARERVQILWQAGQGEATIRHGYDRVGGGIADVRGQHGEIGRAYYFKTLLRPPADDAECLRRLVGYLADGRSFLAMRPRVRRAALELVREAFRDARERGDSALAALDFFYLNERTRRWSPTLLGQRSGLVVAPLLNVDFVRASFRLRAEDKVEAPIHRRLIREGAPMWLDVPFASDSKPPKTLRRLRLPGFGARAKAAVRARLPPRDCPDPEAREALAAGGFWTTIWEPALVPRAGRAVWDAIATLARLEKELQGSSGRGT